ncbi:MAG: hypothetical protein ACE5KG_07410 [Nitrososphaerales archaeon]
MSIHVAVVLARLLVVLLGALIVYLALKSYRKKSSYSMLLLGIGFAIITGSAVAEGVLFEFFSFNLINTHLLESIGIALGFGVIIYSIFWSKS